jgi:E3 ubiquitin-protein ligase RGLG
MWTGQVSFQNKNLHEIGQRPNPYEEVLSIIGKTLAPFDDDGKIPAYGFGDSAQPTRFDGREHC